MDKTWRMFIMKTKKNLIWLVVSLLVISIVLAGCSNNAGSSGQGWYNWFYKISSKRIGKSGYYGKCGCTGIYKNRYDSVTA
jgi:predicted small secreted protein